MNVKRNGVNLGFLAVDSTLEPGPRRPFNFVGALNQHHLSHLSGLTNKVLCPIIPGVIGLDGFIIDLPDKSRLLPIISDDYQRTNYS